MQPIVAESFKKITPKLILGCLISCLNLILLTEPASAYFQDLGLGVRPIGMGEAFTAVADDSNTLLWNAGGLGLLEKFEINAMYSDLYSNLQARLFTGENDSFGFHNLGLIVPLHPPIGNFGFAWTLFTTKFYRENTFVVSYGREISNDVFSLLGVSDQVQDIRVAGGLNLKVLQWLVEDNEFTLANPALGVPGQSRTGVTADLGILVSLPQNFKTGLSLENFIPANVGVTIYETVPINFRLGASYRYEVPGQSPYVDSILGTADFTQRNGLSDIRAGTEAWFFSHLLALRVGTTMDQFSTGASLFTALQHSDFDFRVDYAFSYPYSIQANWGSHRFSVVVRWGKVSEAGKPAVTAAPATQPATLVIEPEVNMAAQREKELAAARAEEEAKLRGLLTGLQVQIQGLRAELQQISDEVRAGQLPPIRFVPNKISLRKSGFPTLDRYGRVLERFAQIKVRIEGHTAASGKDEADLKLSQARAAAVRAYLQRNFKVQPQNLLPVGFGSARPVASNQTPAGRDANTRMDFKVLVPAGLEAVAAASTTPTAAAAAGEEVRAEDIVRYEDVEKLQQQMKVYQLQMNPKEVEELFNQQHRQEIKSPPAVPPAQ